MPTRYRTATVTSCEARAHSPRPPARTSSFARGAGSTGDCAVTSACQHATRRPARSSCEHRIGHPACVVGERAARGERAAGRQCAPGRPAVRGSRRAAGPRSVSMDGTAASSARVYGCRASVSRSAAGRSSTIFPAYMTSTRSQTCPTTVMSWLISSSATSSARPDRLEQRQHLALHGHVERRGRLVGDDERGRTHQAHADHRPLPHAAGELVRELPGAVLGGGYAYRSQPVDRPGHRRLAAHALMTARRPRRAARPIRLIGLNEVIGSWNTSANEVPRNCAAPRRGCGSAEQVLAEELEPVRGDLPGRLDQPGDGERGEALAGAGLADDADRLAAADGEADAADRRDLSGGRGKLTRRPVDGQDGASAGVGRGGSISAGTRCVAQRAATGHCRGTQPDALGDRLAEQVEREPGDDHGDAGGERGERAGCRCRCRPSLSSWPQS